MTNEIVKPSAELIAWTEFRVPDSMAADYAVAGWTGALPEHGSRFGGGEDLIEFAGRACYESWKRPNPKTATVEGYIGHILEVNHGSVLEHANATFYIRGVSRSLTHELVRHRPGFAYSQLSQRYVPAEDSNIVAPPELEGNRQAIDVIQAAVDSAVSRYEHLVLIMQNQLQEQGVTGTEAKKRARQAARAVLPNMTETRIVVTANARAWRHFLTMRAAAPADVEIRRLAVLVYRELVAIWPAVLQDLALVTLDDGTEVVERVGS